MLHLLFLLLTPLHDTTPCSFGDTSHFPPESIDDHRIFTKEEREAYFIGGPGAWKNLVDSTLKASFRHPRGTCTLQFIVRTDGSVVQIVADEDSRFSRVLVKLIKDHPCAWYPAFQNGRLVNAYHKEKIMYP